MLFTYKGQKFSIDTNNYNAEFIPLNDKAKQAMQAEIDSRKPAYNPNIQFTITKGEKPCN